MLNDSVDPAAEYRDPRWFVREQRSVVGRHWMLLCDAGKLRDPGDYASRWFGEASVAVVVGADGQRRAFHNFCLHSAFATLLSGEGNCGTEIVCMVHGWRYTLNGRLTLPSSGGGSTLMKADFVERSGLIFVNAGVDPDQLDSDLTPAAVAALDRLAMADDVVHLDADDIHADANWKFVVTRMIGALGDEHFVYPTAFYVPVDGGIVVITVRPSYIARTYVTVHVASPAADAKAHCERFVALAEGAVEQAQHDHQALDAGPVEKKISEFYGRLAAEVPPARRF
ncbi:MAG: aromatic ring-hydroxylating dioxygenase subunit alpha [Acidimicrobiia bacterium]